MEFSWFQVNLGHTILPPYAILMGYGLGVGGLVGLERIKDGWFKVWSGVPTTSWFRNKLLLGTDYSPTTTFALFR